MPPFPLVPLRDVARSRRIWRTPPATLTTAPRPPLPPTPPPPLLDCPSTRTASTKQKSSTDATREPHGYLMSKDHVVLGAIALTPRTFLGSIDSACRPMGDLPFPTTMEKMPSLFSVVVAIVTTPPPSS